jgi:DNA repair protein RadC
MNQIGQLMEMELIYNPSKTPLEKKFKVNSSAAAYSVLKEVFNWNTIACQEEFIVLYLNRANQVLGVQKLSKGGIHGTVVDKRLLFASALKSLSTSVILAHNHPSGQLLPSECDLKLTRSIKAAGNLLDICVLDHLIVGPEPNEYYSMSEHGNI